VYLPQGIYYVSDNGGVSYRYVNLNANKSLTF
jgi:hypothetical protein